MSFHRLRFAAVFLLILVLAASVWYLRVHDLRPQITKSGPVTDQSAPSPSAGADGANSIALSAPRAEPLSTSVQQLFQHEQWLRDVVASLITQDSAPSLTTAAVLMNASAPVFVETTERRADFRMRVVELMRRAVSKAPYDPTILMIAESFCRQARTDGCDSAQAESNLPHADPGNALAWIGTLEQAVTAGDRKAQEKIVALMAESQRMDNHFADIERIVREGIASVRIPSPNIASHAQVLAVESLVDNATRFSPQLSLAPLGSVCNPPIGESLAANCKKVIELARDRHGEFADEAAMEIAMRLAVPGTADAHALTQMHRRFSWQFIRAMQLPRSTEQTNRIRAGDRDAMREVLIANAVPLEPPDEWRE